MNLMLKIKDLLLICLISFGINQNLSAQECDNFCAGADQPEIYLPLLKNKKVIVLTNQTGVMNDKNHTHLVDFLLANDINIVKIFTPEHGFRGNADAGEHVNNNTDSKTGLPVISLYGDNKKPTAQQLGDADLIVFDVQDVGVRFYTYISTLTYLLEAAGENKKEVMVLDRPNPHDGYTDGPILEKPWASFVGMHPVPIVYGLTIGEYGKMVIGEKWLKKGVQPKYTVVKMANYHKKKRYPISEKPSPNLPNSQAINLYPSLCLFEGTNVSIGRGTDFPFQVFGSPYTKNFDFTFTPKPSYGSKNPPLNGEVCYGIDLRDTPTQLTSLHLKWLLSAYNSYKSPKGKSDFFHRNLFFDKLAGTDRLRKQIIAGKSEKEIKQSWAEGLKNFEKIRTKYIIYPD